MELPERGHSQDMARTFFSGMQVPGCRQAGLFIWRCQNTAISQVMFLSMQVPGCTRQACF